MQLQSHDHQHRRQLLIPALMTYGASILGASTGLLLGRQADILFNVDAGIIGVIVGAVVGSILLPLRTLNPLIRATAAGMGVILPILVLVGDARVAPEVLWGMTAIAVVGSAIISTAIRAVQSRR